VEIYNDIDLISEILFTQGILDDNGVVKLQEVSQYIQDRLAQERARQVRDSVPHAHQVTAVEVIAEMKLSGPQGLLTEPAIVEALARHLGMPFMRLEAL